MSNSCTSGAVLGAVFLSAGLLVAAPPPQVAEPVRDDVPLVVDDPLDRPHEGLPVADDTRIPLTYRVTAAKARLNRKLMGPTRRYVQGVPAEPVDSFVWDGVGSTPIEGTLVMEVQPMSNTGFVKAEWTDAHGHWAYEQTRFLPPHHHPSGARIGSSVSQVDTILNEGVSHNVYLHGNTASGAPVLPTTFAYLGTWGPARVTLDGVLFENIFEIPKPLWIGHLMVTEGTRRADGTVRTWTNQIYDPAHAARGDVEPGDLEVHLTFHDDLEPETSNIPSLFSFFYHLLFEEVRIEIVQSDSPQRLEPPPSFPETP